MSGIEIIGLILGGLPLVISAAEDYKRGFEPFLKWHRYKREFRSFVNSVDLEKQMLDGLLGQLLKYTDLPEDEKRLLLSGNDPEAWHRDGTVQALKVRLGDSYTSCMYILQTMKEDMIKLQNMMSLKDGSVDWAKPGEDKWNYQRKRIAHSFSKKGEETVASLERNNRKFRELLDLLDTKLVDGKPNHRKALTKDTTWAKIFECIRRHANSLHSALKNGWKCNCIVPHLAALQLQERDNCDPSSTFTLTFVSSRVTQKSGSLRKVAITVNQLKTENLASKRPQPTPVQDWYLDKIRDNLDSYSDLQTQSLPGIKKVGFSFSDSSSISSKYSASSKYSSGSSFTNNDSLVTFSSVQSGNGTEIFEKSHHKTWSSGRKSKVKKTVRMNLPPNNENTSSKSLPTLSIAEIKAPSTPHPVKEDTQPAEVKIEDLCSTLEASDENGAYIGNLSGEESMHYEFRSIQDDKITAEKYELISLEKLLANGGRSKLTRKQRFRLAIVLASSILQLQTTPWLAEQLEKKNIYFYQKGSEILADQPYIRHSFPASKIESEISPEEKESQLPHYIRSSTRASLVHLGITLLELCFGQAIEKQTDLRNQYLMNGKAHNDTDYLTARDWIYEVGEEAGEEFENAVKCCVLCNFDVKPNWADTNFTQSVYAGVVEPLEKAYSLFGFVE